MGASKGMAVELSKLTSSCAASPHSISVRSTIERPRAIAWSGVPNEATVQQRLEAVEKNVRAVREDVSAFQNEIDDWKRTQDEDMKRERTDRAAADDAIHRKMKETETGSLELNASGLWLVFFGTIYSTFPVELACALA